MNLIVSGGEVIYEKEEVIYVDGKVIFEGGRDSFFIQNGRKNS